jgi:opacity protein-like surface antigen
MACLGIIASGSGVAAGSDDWEFEVTPYFLAASLDGTAGVRGVEADVDMSFSDIWDNLDAGFMGIFEAQKGPWIFGLEGVYFKLEDEGAKTVTGPFGRVAVDGALDLTTSMYIYQGTVGYRVLDDRTAVDLLGALRYTKLKADMDVTVATAGIVFPGGARSAGGSEGWTDAVVGARVLHPVSDHVDLLGYADVGGGGSDLTWQFILGANWEFRENLTAKLGYRYLDWDYEDGGTKWDMAAAGVYLGLGIRF